jgi:hypothetical protein
MRVSEGGRIVGGSEVMSLRSFAYMSLLARDDRLAQDIRPLLRVKAICKIYITQY